MKDTVDLVFSFDTTGSMYPCLSQVRKYVEGTAKYLFTEIPNIRIGILTHGDYCDGPNFISRLDLTDDIDKIVRFIRNAPATGGGDCPEAYEQVLHDARSFSWTSGKQKAFVIIGDATPHPVGYRCGVVTNKLDWRNETKLLKEAGILVYPVQALGYRESEPFYEGIASLSGTEKLDLEQFEDISDFVMALCMKQANKMNDFEAYLRSRKSAPSISVSMAVDKLAGRKPRARKKSKHSLYAVPPSRFQILRVDEDCAIKDFVEDNGLIFKKGRGFYEFTKTVLVQEYKEVIVQDKETGEMFAGEKAREILGIPVGVRARVKPDKLNDYRGFIQSTSVNRKLLAGTRFLYEVDSAR